jgi:hypothetical protein
MKLTRQTVSLIGLVVTMAVVVYAVVQLSGQQGEPTGDFTNAKEATVRDAQGQVLLRGQFTVAEEEDEDIERRAALTATGIDGDAAGAAEVEYSRTSPVKQEVEFSARNVQPGVTLTFVIDGTDVATAVVDARGRVDVELDVRMPAGR